MDPFTAVIVSAASFAAGSIVGLWIAKDVSGRNKSVQIEAGIQPKLITEVVPKPEPEIQKKLRQLRNDGLRERDLKVAEFRANVAPNIVEKILAGCYDCAAKAAEDYYAVNLELCLGKEIWNDFEFRLRVIEVLIELIPKSGLQFHCNPGRADYKMTALLVRVKY